jgi:hypothetical protein
MRSAKLIVFAVVALSTACSGSGTVEQSNPASSFTPDSADTMPMTPPAFTDFPGDGVVYTEMGRNISVKIKAIDSTWASEVMEKPADPGYHYLVVWVAATPALPDRGADKIGIDEQFYVRYKPASNTCNGTEAVDAAGHCYSFGRPGSQLKVLESADWRDQRWDKYEYVRSDIKRGETRIGQVGFLIDDKTQATGFELCVPSKEHNNSFVRDKYPCTPVKAPDRPR